MRHLKSSQPGGGGRGTWVNFCWVCATGLLEPLPKSILWPIIDPILVALGQICNFRDPNLVTFYFYEVTHFLDRMKNALLFICSTTEVKFGVLIVTTK